MAATLQGMPIAYSPGLAEERNEVPREPGGES